LPPPDTGSNGIWYGIDCISGEVTHLDLSANKLSGTLPPQLALLSHSLQFIDISFNSGGYGHLHGTLPSQFGKFTELNVFALRANHISGTIPLSLSTLTRASLIDLRRNRLSGTIPTQASELCRFTDATTGYSDCCRLQRIDTPTNNLTCPYKNANADASITRSPCLVQSCCFEAGLCSPYAPPPPPPPLLSPPTRPPPSLPESSDDDGSGDGWKLWFMLLLLVFPFPCVSACLVLVVRLLRVYECGCPGLAPYVENLAEATDIDTSRNGETDVTRQSTERTLKHSHTLRRVESNGGFKWNRVNTWMENDR